MSQLYPILRADGSMAGMSDVETVNSLLEKGLIEERISESGIIHYAPTPEGVKVLEEVKRNG